MITRQPLAFSIFIIFLCVNSAVSQDISWDKGADPVSQFNFNFNAFPPLMPWMRHADKRVPQWQKKLNQAALDFMVLWMDKPDARAAVAKYFSPKVDDESLVPAEWYSIKEYNEKFGVYPDPHHPRMPIDNRVAAERMAEYLSKLAEGVDYRTRRLSIIDTLAPIGKNQLLGILEEELGIKPVIDGSGKFASYPLARWADFSWTASSTRGHQTFLQELMAQQDLRMHGVFCLFKYKVGRRTGYSPLFMLWADESPDDSGDWKIWGVVPVPTE